MTTLQLINSDVNKAYRTLVTTQELDNQFMEMRIQKSTTQEQEEEDRRVLREMFVFGFDTITTNANTESKKGMYFSIANTIYYCYNETSLLHFVKCNKKRNPLSWKNKENVLNMSSKQVNMYINLGSIKPL